MDHHKILREKIAKEAKADENLKNDYEKYFWSLFQGKIECKKIPEKNIPTPDFEIFINNKKFITEVKGLDPIYQDITNLVCEICNYKVNKIKLCDCYEIRCSPFHIHRDDKKVIMDEIKEKLQNPTKKLPDIINGNHNKKNYKLTFRKREKDWRTDIEKHGLKSYPYGKITSNLRNALHSDRHIKQYEQIDFLTLINLNQEIDKDYLLSEFFSGSVWFGSGVTTTIFKFFPKYKRIKLVLFLDPSKNKAYLIQRICENKECEKELSDLMFHLCWVLESNKIKTEILCLNTAWEKVGDIRIYPSCNKAK